MNQAAPPIIPPCIAKPPFQTASIWSGSVR